MKFKKILIISYNYFPQINPRALRWQAVAEELAVRGHSVDVVCSKVQGAPEFEIKGGVSVHRVGFRAQANPQAKNISSSQEKPRSVVGVKKVVKWLYFYCARHFIWPDSNFLWITQAQKKSFELLCKKQLNSLISVSHPFSGHVVGHKVYNRWQKECQPLKGSQSLTWALDIGDPFAFLEFVKINNRVLFNNKNFTFEKKIIRQSKRQAVTTDLTKEEYINNGFDCQDSMVVIPPLLRSEMIPKQKVKNKSQSFKWVFVGTLYKKIRNPKFLLQLFETVLSQDPTKNHELHFYGDTKMCQEEFYRFDKFLNKKIFLHGLVSPDIARQACAQAGLLVNIGNKTSYQVPSKLVEYMALGKPVLNIKSILKDSSESFLKKYPLCIHLSESEPVETQAKHTLIHLRNMSELTKEDTHELIAPYTIRAIADSYERLLL